MSRLYYTDNYIKAVTKVRIWDSFFPNLARVFVISAEIV